MTEYITLPRGAAAHELARIVADPARVTATHGRDVNGQARIVLTLTGETADDLAALRQSVLAECRRLGVRAFVV